MMETLMAVGAVVTVFVAVGSILYRVAVGERHTRELDKLKAEIEAQKRDEPSTDQHG